MKEILLLSEEPTSTNATGIVKEYLINPVPIASGRMSICYEGYDPEGIPRYIKQLKNPTPDNIKYFKQAYHTQVSILKQTHNTCGHLVGLYYNGDCPCVVMEKSYGCILKDMKSQTLHDLFCRFQKIVTGIKQFHDCGYLLIDLSPTNIFCLESGSMDGGVYFFDFDSVIETTSIKNCGALRSTAKYSAPELIRGHFDRISKKTDLYALGAIMYSLILSATPLSTLGLANPEKYRKAPVSFRNELQSSVRVREALDLFFARCLAFDPKDRFNSADEMQLALQKLCDLTHPLSKRIVRSTYFPELPEHYVAQTKAIEDLKKFFRNRRNQHAIGFIRGDVSGVGKTTLGKAFLHQMQNEYDVLIFYSYDEKKGLKKGILDNVLLTDRSSDKEEALSRDSQRILILVDNFKAKKSEALPRWGNCHLLFTTQECVDSLFASTQTDNYICVTLGADEAMGTAIFSKVYSDLTTQELTDSQYMDCLRSVGFHPYSCSLLAHLVATHGNYVIKKIDQAFEKIKIDSRKDCIIGEKSKRETYYDHIDALFDLEVSEALKSPIQQDILYFLSLDPHYNKELLVTLCGDNRNLFRFEAHEALLQLQGRGLITITKGPPSRDTVTVHLLLHSYLKRKFKTVIKSEYDYRGFNNIFAVYESREATPYLHYSEWPNGLYLEASASGKEQWMQYIDIIREATGSINLFDSPLSRMINRYADDGTFAVCSITDGTQRFFFLWCPTRSAIVRLIRCKSTYSSETISSEYTIEDLCQIRYIVETKNACGASIVFAGFGISPINIHLLESYLRVHFSELQKARTFCDDEEFVVHIPDGITLGIEAFAGDRLLQNISLPASLTEIPDGCFTESRLKRISIPENVTRIGHCAFSRCALLEQVVFKGNTTIMDAAFTYCVNIRELSIESDVKIGELAFSESIWMKNIHAPLQWLRSHIPFLSKFKHYSPENHEIDSLLKRHRE